MSAGSGTADSEGQKRPDWNDIEDEPVAASIDVPANANKIAEQAQAPVASATATEQAQAPVASAAATEQVFKFLDGLLPIKECGESLVEVDSPAAQQSCFSILPL